MKVSVVVPVYNSSDSLPLLVDEVGKVLPDIADAFELVLVNDGSPDQSWQVISELAQSHPWVCGIDLMRNHGQHNATLCGVREARYEVIVVMDDDLQNPSREIPKLLEKLAEEYDVVYGVSRRRQQAWWKTLASVIVKRTIAYVMGLRTVRDIGAFKAFRADLRRFFKAGIPIEFVDISAETLHMDLEQVEGRLERGEYGGVLNAHTYGESSTPNGFFQTIKSRYPDLILVDNRCLCFPDLEPPQELLADLALYSTGYAKMVELNFGGYAFLNDNLPYRPEHSPFSAKAHEEIKSGYKKAIQNCTPYVYTDSDWLQTDSDLPAWYDYRQ
jgi:glycosyltransferase involved in cell wall biosynthesis